MSLHLQAGKFDAADRYIRIHTHRQTYTHTRTRAHTHTHTQIIPYTHAHTNSHANVANVKELIPEFFGYNFSKVFHTM